MKGSHGLLAAFAVAALGVITAAQQTTTEGSFTAEQATGGKTAYDRRCAGCHLKDLSGATGPGLAGPGFISGWASKPTSDLFDLIKSTMPQGDEGSLTDEEYANIVAYILQVNGHTAGTKQLSGDSKVVIGAGTAPPSSPPAAQ